MSEADKIIESLKNSGRKVEEFYTGNKTSDKNVANIEEDAKEYRINLSQKQSIELLKDTLNKFEIRGEQLYLLKIAIENILADYTRQKQINEEHQKINGELREKVKQLEAKLEFQKFGDLDNIEFEEYMNQFIPKQVVIDKIEEIIRETTPTPVFKPKSMWNNIDYERLYKTQPLQELLEGERK